MVKAALERSLVLVHSEGWQAAEDWAEIGGLVRAFDRRIAVYLCDANEIPAPMRARIEAMPTLVVSPAPVDRLGLARGRVLCGRPTPKFEQLVRLAEAGVTVPFTTQLAPETVLDAQLWGEVVVLKPTDLRTSSHGTGISLIRRERVRYLPPDAYPEGHPGRLGPMLVQRFVDTGPNPTSYRVLMFLGEPLYCQRMEASAPRIGLDAPDDAVEVAPIAMQGFSDRQRFVYDAEVVDIARRAARVFADVPLLGCDVLRDVRTGTLFVTEVNPGGNTWHFSSLFLAEQRVRNGEGFERERRTQLDAFGTAAIALAEATWRLAE